MLCYVMTACVKYIPLVTTEIVKNIPWPVVHTCTAVLGLMVIDPGQNIPHENTGLLCGRYDMSCITELLCERYDISCITELLCERYDMSCITELLCERYDLSN